MTQPEETPAEPIPAQPVQPAQPFQAPQPTQPFQPPQPSGEPAPAWTQQAAADPNQQPQYAAVPAPAYIPVPSPEERAAAAAKKAKRRGLFAKSAILAVPAIALVSLLVVTSIQANALSTKTTAASTAAKTATAAGGLVAQLHSAQSAAEASILVDAGCVAAESKTTGDLETKLDTDIDTLSTAENGTSYSAFTTAANNYINDLQAISTDLQQDAALTSRASLKSAIGALTADLGVVIAAMQEAMSGSLSTSAENNLDTVSNRMDGDATAVDTMCGGTTLGDTGSGSSSTSGNGTTSA